MKSHVRIRLSILTAVFLSIGSMLPKPIAAADRPNVLLICVDDLRPQLGCYGCPEMITDGIHSIEQCWQGGQGNGRQIDNQRRLFPDGQGAVPAWCPGRPIGR